MASGLRFARPRAEAAVDRGILGRHVRPGNKGGAGVGLTRKGKGPKVMAVTDGDRFPIGVLVESAQEAEVKLAAATLETVRMALERGRLRTRPERLTCDRGYDSRCFSANSTGGSSATRSRRGGGRRTGSHGEAARQRVTRRHTANAGRSSGPSRGWATTGGWGCGGSMMWSSTRGSCCSRSR